MRLAFFAERLHPCEGAPPRGIDFGELVGLIGEIGVDSARPSHAFAQGRKMIGVLSCNDRPSLKCPARE
jgi:hypothetical protein